MERLEKKRREDDKWKLSHGRRVREGSKGRSASILELNKDVVTVVLACLRIINLDCIVNVCEGVLCG